MRSCTTRIGLSLVTEAEQCFASGRLTFGGFDGILCFGCIAPGLTAVTLDALSQGGSYG